MPLRRPRSPREHVLPALVVLFPAEWFVLRAVGTHATRGGDPLPVVTLLLGTALAVGGAVVVSALAVRAVRTRDPTGPLAAVVHPSDGTLAVLGVVLTLVAVHLAGSLFVTATGPLAAVLAAGGLVLGLPLVLAYAASVAAGNALSLPPAVETAAAVVGLAGTAVWTVGLAAVGARLLGRLR